MRRILISLMVLLNTIPVAYGASEGKARHVVLIVWDGMRPDFISEENTPTLFQLARQGVWFDNHHPVYLSATEVNGTALATGAYPAHDGIVGNREYRPDIDAAKTFHTEEFDYVRKGDLATHGHYIKLPTLAELLHKKNMKTIIAGAKPIALLHDRAARTNLANGPVLFAAAAFPVSLATTLTNLYGDFPATNATKVTRNDWTTSALIDSFWSNGIPPYTLLWMNEPDAAQHATGPGSAKSLAAIKNADDNLARVLRALEDKGARDQTDIMVVSDHGFSTVLSLVDLADSLNHAGFKAARDYTNAPATTGDIVVSGNGGAVLLYVVGHDSAVTKKLVKFLQGWNYTGVIFTRQPMEGTFTLAQGHLDAPTAPDVFVSMRWRPDRNDAGTPGMLTCDICPYGPGQGMHGSLSPFEMHNTFIAAGPDFRSGVVDHLPTGNVDIAPTILWILGVKRPKTMDGRVVAEAMLNIESTIKSFEPSHLEAARDLDKVAWHQYLNFTEVNGVTYFDEGNGYQTPK